MTQCKLKLQVEDLREKKKMSRKYFWNWKRKKFTLWRNLCKCSCVWNIELTNQPSEVAIRTLLLRLFPIWARGHGQGRARLKVMFVKRSSSWPQHCWFSSRKFGQDITDTEGRKRLWSPVYWTVIEDKYFCLLPPGICWGTGESRLMLAMTCFD